MRPDKTQNALLDQRLDDIWDGLAEAIEREVDRRRREGLPICVAENDTVVDLQTVPSNRSPHWPGLFAGLKAKRRKAL